MSWVLFMGPMLELGKSVRRKEKQSKAVMDQLWHSFPIVLCHRAEVGGDRVRNEGQVEERDTGGKIFRIFFFSFFLSHHSTVFF